MNVNRLLNNFSNRKSPGTQDPGSLGKLTERAGSEMNLGNFSKASKTL